MQIQASGSKRHPIVSVSDRGNARLHSAQRDFGPQWATATKAKPRLLFSIDDLSVNLYHNGFGYGFHSLVRLLIVINYCGSQSAQFHSAQLASASIVRLLRQALIGVKIRLTFALTRNPHYQEMTRLTT